MWNGHVYTYIPHVTYVLHIIRVWYKYYTLRRGSAVILGPPHVPPGGV